MAKLKKRDVDNAQPIPGKNFRLWDDDPRGFGVYVKPSGVKSFFVQYPSPVTAKKRRYTIGQYGRVTLDQARTIAKEILASVAKGEDPLVTRAEEKEKALTTADTMSELCDAYFQDATAGLVTYRGRVKKPSTLATDKGRIERHIKPLIGDRLARDVTRRDVERFLNQVRLGKTAGTWKTGPRGRAVVTGGAGTAYRTLSLVSAIFSYAIKLGIRKDNPVRGIERPATGKRDKVLSPDEYKRLGKAMNDQESNGANKVALNAYRALALTGCRRGEIFGLKRSEIDTHRQCLRFGDTKTGAQVRAVGSYVMDILAPLIKDLETGYVFPATRGDKHLTDAKLFKAACDNAKLENVSLHTLRHSFASVGLELEYSELTIAGLLGHRSHSVTSRYSHHVDQALITAADRISAIIERRMAGKQDTGDNVVPLKGKHA